MPHTTDKTEVLWSGEHWILYLRRPGETTNSASLSLYNTHYSPAGQGTVALVAVEGEPGVAPVMCAEDRELAAFVSNNVVVWGASPFERDVPVVDATFLRGGDVRTEPVWRIDTGQAIVEARWPSIEPVVVMNEPPPAQGVAVVHSLLFFSQGTIGVNGEPVEGEPFIRENWRRTIGRPGSSCCFALAETLLVGR